MTLMNIIAPVSVCAILAIGRTVGEILLIGNIKNFSRNQISGEVAEQN